jgi:hypothetical protein
MKVNTGVKMFFGAIILSTGLTACHSYANDNTSRPCVPDANGNNVGNDEIMENRSMGNDANPRNIMWDGMTTPEERVGGRPDECCEKNEDKMHGETEMHSGHDQH